MIFVDDIIPSYSFTNSQCHLVKGITRHTKYVKMCAPSKNGTTKFSKQNLNQNFGYPKTLHDFRRNYKYILEQIKIK
jgi:hypothetical protein